eukprot:15532-Heterococcus_DN1.PRE.3
MSSLATQKRMAEEQMDMSLSASLTYVASGVSGLVVDRGSLHRFVPYMVQSVRHGYQDLGVSSLHTAHEQVYSGKISGSSCSSSSGSVLESSQEQQQQQQQLCTVDCAVVACAAIVLRHQALQLVVAAL